MSVVVVGGALALGQYNIQLDLSPYTLCPSQQSQYSTLENKFIGEILLTMALLDPNLVYSEGLVNKVCSCFPLFLPLCGSRRELIF